MIPLNINNNKVFIGLSAPMLLFEKKHFISLLDSVVLKEKKTRPRRQQVFHDGYKRICLL
jgi:hypothetical protein